MNIETCFHGLPKHIIFDIMVWFVFPQANLSWSSTVLQQSQRLCLQLWPCPICEKHSMHTSLFLKVMVKYMSKYYSDQIIYIYKCMYVSVFNYLLQKIKIKEFLYMYMQPGSWDIKPPLIYKMLVCTNLPHGYCCFILK